MKKPQVKGSQKVTVAKKKDGGWKTKSEERLKGVKATSVRIG